MVFGVPANIATSRRSSSAQMAVILMNLSNTFQLTAVPSSSQILHDSTMYFIDVKSILV